MITRLDEELVSPAVERLEGGGDGDVVDEDAAVGAAVEGDAQRLESLLPRRVPDLHRHQPVVHHHLQRPKTDLVSIAFPLKLLAQTLLVHEAMNHNGA